ncbi:DMT family transporter [Limnohabitans sp.]|uniref:DMT family transporter n=1 Tax=Limnohabitans sp. TaxID=1907725 RepID=UPI003918A639
MSPVQRLSVTGFATLLLIALMMGANHVAARLAFNHGVNVITAVSVRSGVTALVVLLILWHQRVAWQLGPRHRRYLPLIGVLIAVQSVCLYSSVARLPVALALLVFNTYPIATAMWARVLYGHRPERFVVMVMPVMMVGLALALDVMGATSGLGAAAHWGQIGLGVLFALGASTTFGLAMVLTQYEAGDLDGRLRTFTTMAQVAIWASLASLTGGGWQLPVDAAGWLGLGLLTFFYGTAFTLMFTVLPRLGVVGNSAIMNVEPVFALVLAWAFLNQAIAPVQLLGAAIVVGTVMALGLRKRS